MLQPKLSFPQQNQYHEADFIATPANKLALFKINSWPGGWTHSCYPTMLLLYGPRYSGKTHLAHVWRRASGAKFVVNIESYLENLEDRANIVLEDIDRLDYQEKQLFALFNTIKEKNVYCLFTCSSYPLSFKTQDLSSSVNSIDVATILNPDKQTLEVMLTRALSESALKVEDKVIKLLVELLPHNFAAVRHAIMILNDTSLALGKSITSKMVRDLFLEHDFSQQ